MTEAAAVVAALDRAGLLVTGPPDELPPLSGVTEDSRAVKPGWWFCAVEGTVADGHRFVRDAVDRGAAAVIVTHSVDAGTTPQIIVTESRAAAAVAAATYFDRPADALDVIGITGTNGKSTTVALLRHVLNAARDVGSIGTLGAFDGTGEALYREGLTTPGAIALQGTLRRLCDVGTRRVVMEVSSHALRQHRVHDITMAAAVFTNLTHDHLDYHADFADYVDAKRGLARFVRPDGAVVVNADEPRWGTLPSSARTTTFGLSQPADVRATEVVCDAHGARFSVVGDGLSMPVTTPLLGAFNVSNALAAFTTAWRLGMDPAAIAQRLATLPVVPGRMEPLHRDRFLVLRDYAHTPDALQRALDAARPLATRRLIVVFGAGGDRDRSKREAMGRFAATHADLAIVTSDNPRTEDPDRIIDDVVAGMEGHAHLRVTDRREAIARALRLVESGDVLLLAGKGHETYQVLGRDHVPFDEREIVRALLMTETR